MTVLHAADAELGMSARAGRSIRAFGVRHGAPILLSVLLWWLLWWGHTPSVATTDEAMKHVSWIGVLALLYVAWQARAVLSLSRKGVGHSLVEILGSLLPLFVVGYAFVDWIRGGNPLSVFQVVVMAEASLATLIDVVIFTWLSLRLNRMTMAFTAEGH